MRRLHPCSRKDVLWLPGLAPQERPVPSFLATLGPLEVGFVACRRDGVVTLATDAKG